MKRIKGLDFARAFGAIGIIAFHFYCHSSSIDKVFYAHANGMWGGTLNYLFFCLSGLVIHLKYKNNDSYKGSKVFYYRRWRAMMPAYIMVWSFAYFLKVAEYGKFFYYNIPKARILLSLIGLDGYFTWIGQTYFITGEWFLGAVLILYFCYPFLRKAFEKHYLIVVALTFVAYEVRMNAPTLKIENIFVMPEAVSPFTCILCFEIGMLMATHYDKIASNYFVFTCFAISIIMLTIPFGGNNITKEILTGSVLLVCLNTIGERLCRVNRIEVIISTLSGLSYYTFLLHHSIIYKVLENFDSSNTRVAFFTLIVITVVVLYFSWILQIVMNKILKKA